MIDDEELDEARSQKLEERLAEFQKRQEIEAQKKSILRHIVTPEAYERLMNVRIANQFLYDQVVTTLIYLYQNKQIKGKVSDEQVKKLLERVTARKESKIQILKK
jgi:programmed cell death protein 5